MIGLSLLLKLTHYSHRSTPVHAMSGCSRSTQTDLNVELLINFLKFDLPRMISNDIVPIVYKAVAKSQNSDICKDIQQLITRLIAENLPTSKPLVSIYFI